jgi:hypothetical protein
MLVNPRNQRATITARIQQLIDRNRTVFGSDAVCKLLVDRMSASVAAAQRVTPSDMDAAAIFDALVGDDLEQDGMLRDSSKVHISQLTAAEYANAASLDDAMCQAFGHELVHEAFEFPTGRLRVVVTAGGHHVGLIRANESKKWYLNDTSALTIAELGRGVEKLALPSCVAMSFVGLFPGAEVRPREELAQQNLLRTGFAMPYVADVGGKPKLVTGVDAAWVRVPPGTRHSGNGYGAAAAAAARAALCGPSDPRVRGVRSSATASAAAGRRVPAHGPAPLPVRPAPAPDRGVLREGGACRVCGSHDHLEPSDCWKCWACKEDLFKCSKSGCARRRVSGSIHYSRIEHGSEPPPGYGSSMRQQIQIQIQIQNILVTQVKPATSC